MFDAIISFKKLPKSLQFPYVWIKSGRKKGIGWLLVWKQQIMANCCELYHVNDVAHVYYISNIAYVSINVEASFVLMKNADERNHLSFNRPENQLLQSG